MSRQESQKIIATAISHNSLFPSIVQVEQIPHGYLYAINIDIRALLPGYNFEIMAPRVAPVRLKSQV